jgi:phosphoglycolate phosphatase-like HAD superfamily hydrolase
MQKVRLVVLDIGGTIIEDNGEVVSSFHDALRANGLDVSDAELRELKG